MKKAIKWFVLGLVLIGVLLSLLVGPGRLYGLLRARQFEGRVVKIQALGMEADEIAESHLVELHSTEGEVCMFASSDRKWVMVAPGEHVRVRLYPAPPWSGQFGQWQNGSLLTKLLPPATRQERPLDSPGGSSALTPTNSR